jgi:hypothetical protein
VTVHSRGNLNSDHRRHDRLLVTRYAADDSYPGEQGEAETLIASCSECAELAADIRLLSQRTHQLAAPRRPRDFRISAEQADKLRGSWLERFMRGIAAPGWGTALRPLAGAAFAIGMTLMVVGALPMSAAQPAGAPPADMEIMAATDAPAIHAPTMESVDAPAEQAPGDMPVTRSGGDADPGVSDDGNAAADPNTFSEVYLSPAPEEAELGIEQRRALSSDDGGSLLIVAGAIAVAFAIALFVLVWFARRRFGDALLR